MGRPFTDFLTEDSRAIFHERFPQFVRDGSIKDLELELVRGSGTPMPVLERNARTLAVIHQSSARTPPGSAQAL